MTPKIVNAVQLETLQNHTMIYAVIVFLAALLVAFIIANLIKYKGGQDKSYISRRIGFIVTGIVACVAFYLYNDLVVKGLIPNAGFKSMFVKTNITCLGIVAGGYTIVGLLLMFIFRNSKFGSILGKKRD